MHRSVNLAPDQAPKYGTLSLVTGEKLFDEGSAGHAAFLVEAGEIEIYVTRGGRDVSLARRGVGELIGEIAVIDGGVRSASARAASDCRLLVIEAEKLEGRAGASDPVLQLCLGVVVQRYRHAMSQLKAITAGTRREDEAAVELPGPAVPDSDPVFAQATETLRQENDLSRGLRADEFVLYFQPIIRLGTRRLAGFEALMRWRHPERGLVPPGSFIPMAEAGGLIVELTRWALSELGRVMPAVFAAERSNPDGTERLFMTVNVSAADLMQPEFPEHVSAMLAGADLPPGRLKIEVTESMIMTDVEHASATLRSFAQAGIGVAIDDFGTGYSSLSSLATLPISTLKIDRSFIQSMLTDPLQHRIVSTILHLARELDIPVVAEGIEDEAAASALTAMRCDYGQGYLFGRPLPQTAMLATIAAWQAEPLKGASL